MPQGKVASSDRRALLAKVHIARKALALEEDSYRALVLRITGHDSAGDCADTALVALLDEFKRLGFTAAKRKSEKPFVRLIYALWKELQPHLTDGSREALRSFVRRQTGVVQPEWLDAAQANKVTEGLKAWLKRERATAEASDGTA